MKLVLRKEIKETEPYLDGDLRQQYRTTKDEKIFWCPEERKYYRLAKNPNGVEFTFEVIP